LTLADWLTIFKGSPWFSIASIKSSSSGRMCGLAMSCWM
jgi:hypothetical protein